MDDLRTFIDTTRDARELKRALAIQLSLRKHPWNEIVEELGVSRSFINKLPRRKQRGIGWGFYFFYAPRGGVLNPKLRSKWRSAFKKEGVSGLSIRYQGSVGYLTSERREQVLAWLKQQQTWNLAELMTCVRDTCGVVYQSKQSYYDLFAQSGISWKKSQKRNPRRDPLKVRARREEIKKKGSICVKC